MALGAKRYHCKYEGCRSYRSSPGAIYQHYIEDHGEKRVVRGPQGGKTKTKSAAVVGKPKPKPPQAPRSNNQPMEPVAPRPPEPESIIIKFNLTPDIANRLVREMPDRMFAREVARRLGR